MYLYIHLHSQLRKLLAENVDDKELLEVCTYKVRWGVGMCVHVGERKIGGRVGDREGGRQVEGEMKASCIVLAHSILC